MTTPNYLPNVGTSTNWGSAIEFRLRDDTNSAYAIYGAWDPSLSNWLESTPVHSIKVTFSTDTWSDNSTSSPHHVTQDASYVYCWTSTAMTSLEYQFARPTAASGASWISSGGGATGGTAVPSKKVFSNFW